MSQDRCCTRCGEKFPPPRRDSLRSQGAPTAYQAFVRPDREMCWECNLAVHPEFRRRTDEFKDRHKVGRPTGSLTKPKSQEHSVVGQLETLADLHKRGLLTDHEFHLAKKRLLDG